jgi:WASH complex subunit 7
MIVINFSFLEIAGEVQLRTYGRFLEEYGAQLKGIEEALEDSVCDSWDVSLGPISLQVMCTLIS